MTKAVIENQKLEYASIPPSEAPRSLKKAVMTGTAWTLFGYSASQVLRLGSNLIMTRLLVPEAFGVMSLVYVVMSGLQMFSDVGIQPALVQHKRGEDPVFVNTAWTIQVIRGFVLWAAACLMSWPASLWFEEPMLRQLIPVAALTAIIGGFNSTSLALLNRKLILGKQTVWDLVSQVGTIVVMVAWAWRWPGVWALVVGGIVGSLIKVLLSHVALPGIKHRLIFNREAAGQLMRFGRWIFISTMFSFLAISGDKFILGRILTKDILGVYTVAQSWSLLAITIMSTLSGKVLFPIYAQITRGDQDTMILKFRRLRKSLLAIIIPFPVIMAVFGNLIILQLYKPIYGQAGWMLELMSIGVLFQTVNLTMSPVLLAVGDSFGNMVWTISKAVLLFLAMCVGAYYAGVKGMIIGISLSHFLNYGIIAFLLKNTKTWMPFTDLITFVSSGAVIVALKFF